MYDIDVFYIDFQGGVSARVILVIYTPYHVNNVPICSYSPHNVCSISICLYRTILT